MYNCNRANQIDLTPSDLPGKQNHLSAVHRRIRTPVYQCITNSIRYLIEGKSWSTQLNAEERNCHHHYIVGVRLLHVVFWQNTNESSESFTSSLHFHFGKNVPRPKSLAIIRSLRVSLKITQSLAQEILTASHYWEVTKCEHHFQGFNLFWFSHDRHKKHHPPVLMSNTNGKFINK